MTDERLDNEEVLIRTYFEPLAAGYPGAFGLVDDCAAITPPPGTDLVVKTDPVRAGVHFLPDDDPADIAWKAVAVNVSDLVAKGAVPLVYLAALSFPEAPTRGWLEAFTRGLGEAQAAFGCHLAGGDTDRAPGPLSVAITVVGTVPTGRMIRRATARAGDRIFVSGTIGDAGLGLLLRSGAAEACSWGLSDAERDALVRRYFRPLPKLALVEPLRAYAGAAMDLSDGLIKDLDRMCRASGVGASVRLADVPSSEMGHAVGGVNPDWRRRAVTAGDDYEVLCTVAAADAAAFQASAAARSVAVTCIGDVIEGHGLRVLGEADVEIHFNDGGWDHFARRTSKG